MTAISLARQVGQALKARQWRAVTAESCTGGGVSAAITEIAGSSGWFDCAFVTYSNEAKQDMLGVRAETLTEYGAVSEPVVKEMAQGALIHSRGQISVAISGIAGPDGGTPDKPVGTVCFAWADTTGWLLLETCCFRGDRQSVREQAVARALQGILDRLNQMQ
ncbi:nicotinamide-nucleotide amidase [Photobacterium galatheae]|uniref:Damage-inducible protein CinA n=1 Tax=Photobacterium galatheae TaxID=1654360 RepID=A0A066RYZ8_9GAMM|nr:nicotinamide-nucleotide amidase [Photobacterium galatheae]KDM92608.1 damage-inducible protein CinA [Photobacterium galatheae]MCM0149473.1 nicotinamide-nucleotide amidase [Photobacterium galatheae]